MRHFVLFVLLILITKPLTAQSLKYVSAENGLFARQAPDRGARSITKLHYGTKVELLDETGLKMDLLEKEKKVSGQWVKVRVQLPNDLVTGYVFDHYLTSERIEPRTVVSFEDMELTIHGMELYESEGQDYESKRNLIQFYAELGMSPENKQVQLKLKKNVDRIAVYQAYQTSLTIQNEGPHCDLLEWKHYDSIWLPLNLDEEQSFTILSYKAEEGTKFVDVDFDDIKKAVREFCGSDYAERIKQLEEIDYPAAISISMIYLKIVMFDEKGERTERIIAFEIPMGC